MSDAPALRQADLASSSSAGLALIGPGGWINFAVEPGVTVVATDDRDSEVEVLRLAVFDGPEVHPTKTSGTITKVAPMRQQRRFATHHPAWVSTAVTSRLRRSRSLRTNGIASGTHRKGQEMSIAQHRTSVGVQE